MYSTNLAEVLKEEFPAFTFLELRDQVVVFDPATLEIGIGCMNGGYFFPHKHSPFAKSVPITTLGYTRVGHYTEILEELCLLAAELEAGYSSYANPIKAHLSDSSLEWENRAHIYDIFVCYMSDYEFEQLYNSTNRAKGKIN